MYHMEIETYILDADREELEVVIEVTKYNYDGGYAGYTYGPPEQCYQGEGATAELEEYVIRDARRRRLLRWSFKTRTGLLSKRGSVRLRLSPIAMIGRTVDE